jgi:hypothetical protein
LHNIDILREAKVFGKMQVLVFYDNSTDASLLLLHAYRSRHRGTVFIEENQQMVSFSHVERTERIAHARNRLLFAIQTRFPHYNYFAMMDSNH